MSISDINTTIDTITYCDFDNLQSYLTILYNEIIDNTPTTIEKINNFKTSPLLYDDTRIKIKDDFIDSDMNISQYINRLTDNSEPESIFNEMIYGLVSKSEIQDKYTNFVRNYTNYEKEGGDTHEELIKNIKLNIVLLGNPSLFVSDNNRTPLDSLIGNDSQEYKNINISSSDLQLLL